MDNRIKVLLTPENKEAVLQAVRSVKSGMTHWSKLTEDDRKSLAKMVARRMPLVQKSPENANQNNVSDPGAGLPAASPNVIDLYSFIATLENDLVQLLEMVSNTNQLAGGEGNDLGRFIYTKAKMNVKLGIPGSQAIVDELDKLYQQNDASNKVMEAK